MIILGLDCELDIQRTTHLVRSFRRGLVQTEAQYQFIYTAINHYVQSICSRISAKKVSNLINSLIFFLLNKIMSFFF